MADEQNTSILLPIDIEAEMRKSYLDYAMSVIIARALPDVRDGLKPVQRRILVAMNDLGLASNRGYRKCAKICSDTSGNYHPHGEAVIYPALVRLAQDFNMRYPLIDGQGNFGSVDGDPPAAMRYTEARLAKISEDILADLEKETVDFIPNFDQTRDEPSREGMRIVIELKRGEESQLILNNLFKYTQMQESFGMILLSIVGGQPRELGLIAMIKLFIEHRIDVIRRRTIFELKKAEQREHILLGYQIALDHLDNVIRIIRGSSSRVDAKENLFKYFSEQDVTITENGKARKIEGVKLDGRKYRAQGAPEIEEAGRGDGLGLSYAQIDAILELQLHRLTQLSIDEILKELKSIRELIAELREILASDKKLKQVITA